MGIQDDPRFDDMLRAGAADQYANRDTRLDEAMGRVNTYASPDEENKSALRAFADDARRNAAQINGITESVLHILDRLRGPGPKAGAATGINPEKLVGDIDEIRAANAAQTCDIECLAGVVAELKNTLGY